MSENIAKIKKDNLQTHSRSMNSRDRIYNSFPSLAPVQPKIPEYVKKNLRGLLENIPSDSNISTDELYRRYKEKFEAPLVSECNCSSFKEVLSRIPELVKMMPDKVSSKIIVIPVRNDEARIKHESPGELGPAGRRVQESNHLSPLFGSSKEEDQEVSGNVAKMMYILDQLKDMKLSTEEKISLENMSLNFEKILECKSRASDNPVNVSGSKDQSKQKIETRETRDTKNSQDETPRLIKNLGPKKSEVLQNVKSIYSLLNVNDWSRVSGIPSYGSKGIDLGIAVSTLKKSKRLVVSCMGDKKLKMFSPNGSFLKIVTCVEAEDGNLTDPAAIVSLEDGGFAVSDKTRVLVFDDDGKYLKTIWSKKVFKNGIESTLCYGLGQDDQKRLVLLLDSRDKTFLCIINLQISDTFYCYDVRDIVKGTSPPQKGKSKFRFLSVRSSFIVVTDYELDTVYVLKFSLGGTLLKDIEISGLKKPAGASADHQGNIIVADYENKKLCIFSAEGKGFKTIEVSFKCLKMIPLK